MNIELNQIITQIIAFLVMLWVLKRYAWKPILKVMEDRKNKIKSDFAFIEEQQNAIQNLKKDYEKKIAEIDAYAKVQRQEAIEEGKRIAQEIQREAQQKARKILNQAQDDLQKEIYSAKVQLKDELVKMTLMSTEKILQHALEDKEQQNDFISGFLSQRGLID